MMNLVKFTTSETVGQHYVEPLTTEELDNNF